MNQYDIWVNFNAVGQMGGDRMPALLEHAENFEAIFVGNTVTAGDSDGNRCRGTVVEMYPSGPSGLATVVMLKLDMTTFKGAQK